MNDLMKKCTNKVVTFLIEREKCMDFDYTVTAEKSFDETVKAVERETKTAGFRVLYIHDVAETLKEKGFKIEPFKIIELCNAKSAYAVLKADIKIGLCLPLQNKRLSERRKNFHIRHEADYPSSIFPNAGLGSVPDEVDAIMRRIIDKSK